jgi:uncharacterized glyoxalase superfamily protein PhnB
MQIHEVFPYLRARNAEEAIDFYKRAFGAVEKFRLVEPGGRLGHAELMFGEATIMISDEYPEMGIHALDPGQTSGLVLHLHVEDADAMVAAAIEAGAHLIRDVKDQFYGERSGTVRDPFGYDWMIGHSIEEMQPDEMQRRYDKLFAGG